MGIPDSILLKPGKLTIDEWNVMRKHPLFAYNMLWPIEYLRPAIDIPYCHHERWDGGGYPRGLKGDEIPLPARIFSIIDVWDAMRSDRPYRAALSEDLACEYIFSASGSHFDPKIVEAFFDMIVKLPCDGGNGRMRES
jgi:HD-GYP domain-containing protein (c-di-GMP phosphodiesterase class II)